MEKFGCWIGQFWSGTRKSSELHERVAERPLVGSVLQFRLWPEAPELPFEHLARYRGLSRPGAVVAKPTRLTRSRLRPSSNACSEQTGFAARGGAEAVHLLAIHLQRPNQRLISELFALRFHSLPANLFANVEQAWF